MLEYLSQIQDKPVRFMVGLDAGNSARGVDAALVRCKGSGPDLKVKPVRTQHFEYHQGLRNRLLTLSKSAREIGLIHFELGEHMAEAAEKMLAAASDEGAEVDAIALRGFILAHIPQRGDSPIQGHLRIGEPALIAESTGLPVLYDFFTADMAAGGQGIPGAAYADWLLLSRQDRTVLGLHLGAYSRMTVIPPAHDDLVSFEAGPANILLDGAVRLVMRGNRDLDRNGAGAARGERMEDLLEELLRHPYFGRVPPKSADRTEFLPENYLAAAWERHREGRIGDDLFATSSALVAGAIEKAYERFVKPRFDISRIIVDGGGLYNDELMQRVHDVFSDVVIRGSEDYGLDPMGLDAVRTAVLANEILGGKANRGAAASGSRRAGAQAKWCLP